MMAKMRNGRYDTSADLAEKTSRFSRCMRNSRIASNMTDLRPKSEDRADAIRRFLELGGKSETRRVGKIAMSGGAGHFGEKRESSEEDVE